MVNNMFVKPLEQRPIPSKESKTKAKKKEDNQSFADSLESIVGPDAVEVTYSKDQEERNKQNSTSEKKENKSETSTSSDNGLNITV